MNDPNDELQRAIDEARTAEERNKHNIRVWLHYFLLALPAILILMFLDVVDEQYRLITILGVAFYCILNWLVHKSIER